MQELVLGVELHQSQQGLTGLFHLFSDERVDSPFGI